MTQTLSRPLEPTFPGFTLTSRREDAQHLLFWQARGQTRFVVDGSPLTLAPGTALWIPAGTEHRFTTTPNSALLPMFFETWRVSITASEPTVMPVDATAETAVLALIASQFSLIRPPAPLEQIVLGLVEAHLHEPSGTAMPHSLTARRIARSIIVNPADPRTLTDWAAELHVSTRTLERQFRTETALGWKQWRHEHRMRRAERLLSSTALPVTEIAAQVGFGSPSAFSRAFRERHRVTPRHFRDLAESAT